MTSHPFPELHLTDVERDRWAAACAGLTYPIVGSYERFVHAARTAALMSLGPAVQRALSDQRNAPRPAAALILRNMPFDPGVMRGLIDPDHAESVKPDDLSEAALVGAAASMGEPYGVATEGPGLISNLCPTPAAAGSDTGLGSRRQLGGHVEHGFGRLLPGDRAPDGLALIGVCADPERPVETLLADGRAALALLSPDIQATLRDPERFVIRPPVRWRPAVSDEARPTAVVTGPDDAPSFIAALYGDMTEGRDAGARRALADLSEAVEASVQDVVIEPGTLVLIDNHVALHGRRPFEARFDADGRPYRWLQRVFWTSSLRRFGGWDRRRDRLMIPS